MFGGVGGADFFKIAIISSCSHSSGYTCFKKGNTMDWIWKNFLFLSGIWAFTSTPYGAALIRILIDDFEMAEQEARRMVVKILNYLKPFIQVEFVCFIFFNVCWMVSSQVDNEALASALSFFCALALIVMGFIVMALASFVPLTTDFRGERKQDFIRVVRTFTRPFNISAFVLFLVSFLFTTTPMPIPWQLKMGLVSIVLLGGSFGAILNTRTNIPYTIAFIASLVVFAFNGYYTFFLSAANQVEAKQLRESITQWPTSHLAKSLADNITDEVIIKTAQLYNCSVSGCSALSDVFANGKALYVNRSDQRLLSGNLPVVKVVDPENLSRQAYVLAFALSGSNGTQPHAVTATSVTTGTKGSLQNLAVLEYRWVRVDQCNAFIPTYINPQPPNGGGYARHSFEIYEENQTKHAQAALNAVALAGTEGALRFFINNPDEDGWVGDYFKLKGVCGYVSPTNVLMVKVTRTR